MASEGFFSEEAIRASSEDGVVQPIKPYQGEKDISVMYYYYNRHTVPQLKAYLQGTNHRICLKETERNKRARGPKKRDHVEACLLDELNNWDKKELAENLKKLNVSLPMANLKSKFMDELLRRLFETVDQAKGEKPVKEEGEKKEKKRKAEDNQERKAKKISGTDDLACVKKQIEDIINGGFSSTDDLISKYKNGLNLLDQTKDYLEEMEKHKDGMALEVLRKNMNLTFAQGLSEVEKVIAEVQNDWTRLKTSLEKWKSEQHKSEVKRLKRINSEIDSQINEYEQKIKQLTQSKADNEHSIRWHESFYDIE
jgi:hypothetical protein